MRQREDFKDGTLGADLDTGVTTIDFGSDPGFATIAAPDYATLIIDPEGAGNGPEVVYLTAFTATQTTGTITRGEEGTSDPGVTHASGTVWRHGPTIEDFDRFVWAYNGDDPSDVAAVEFDLTGFEVYRIVGWLRPANDNVLANIRLSNDGGSTFRSGASDYQWGYYVHNITANGENKYADAHDSEMTLYNGIGNAAAEGIDVDIQIINAGTANRKTAMLGHCVGDTYNENYVQTLNGGKVNTAEVNDAIQFLFSAGNIAAGRLAIYGYPTP